MTTATEAGAALREAEGERQIDEQLGHLLFTSKEIRSRPVPASRLTRWLKFNLVGAIGILVQFGALFLLTGVLHFEYLLATAIAVEAAIVHNFVWHEQFTWADRIRLEKTIVKTGCGYKRSARDRIEPSLRESLVRLLRFHLANGAVSLLGNLALMKVMVGLGHVNYLVANLIAIALCSAANFLVSETWVFDNRAEDQAC